MGLPLEVPVFSPDAARRAAANGAGRIELNASGSYPAGGLTPPEAHLAATSLGLDAVPVRIMIRPRGPPAHGGPDFIYTDEEFNSGMLEMITLFRRAGLLVAGRGDGFVFGVLKLGADNSLEVDVERNSQLVKAAVPYGCTFHRAFDEILGQTRDWEGALADVVACGFDAILTSGGPGKAIDHGTMLRRIMDSAGGRLQIIIGGGVRSSNVGDLLREVSPSGNDKVWMHSSCLTSPDSEAPDEEEVAALVDQSTL